MLKQLNEKLVSVKADLNLRDALTAKLRKTSELLMREKRRHDFLSAILIKEGYDVKQLEGLTFTALFHTVLGDKTERLQKERQEFLTAILNNDECEQSIKALESDLAEFEDRLKTLSGVEEEYAVILREKAALVTKTTSRQAALLMKIGEQYAGGEVELQQLTEAAHAGRAVMQVLKDAENNIQASLDLGEKFATTISTPNFVGTSAHFDNAKNAVSQVQSLLHRFELEMSDVGFESIRLEVKFNITDWDTFAEKFFSNAVSAWALAGNLGKALVNIQTFNSEIKKLVTQLDERIEDTKDAQSVISAEWRQMVESIDEV